MEKSDDFQMRAVRSQDLIETDEGGRLMGYNELVNSRTSLPSMLQVGVPAPDVPVSIDVGSEYSRAECSSRQLVGLKVKNRTISFRLDFHDFPRLPETDLEGARKQMQAIGWRQFTRRDMSQSAREETDGDANAADNLVKSEDFPFEVRLCKWLAECLQHRGINVKDPSLTELLYMRIGEKSADQIYRKRLIDDDEQTRLLEEDISRFIHHLGITHYVSAIELGGLRFSILAEKGKKKNNSVDGSASVKAQPYGGLEACAEHSRSRSSHEIIGRITKNGDREVVTPEDEAVIGCQFRPISSLVHNTYFQLAVNKAVQKYIETKTKCKCCFDIKYL